MLIGLVFMGGGDSSIGVRGICESVGSSLRDSTLQSEKVVVGGNLSSTVRKVSWK